MLPSPVCFALLEKLEGYLPVATKDKFGVYNVGFGHRLGKDDIYAGLTRTPEEARRELEDDVATAAAGINELVTAALTQQQFDALVSFVYNIGVDKLRFSQEFLPTLNAGKYRAAADLLLEWAHVDGVFVEGLYERREKERDLFLSGTMS